MSLIQRIPWTRQPQIVVGIDWSNPLTRELITCFSAPDGALVEKVSGKRFIPTTITIQTDAAGRVAKHSNRYVDAGIPQISAPIDGGCAVLMLAKPHPTNREAGWCQRQASNSNHIELRFSSSVSGLASTNGALWRASSDTDATGCGGAVDLSGNKYISFIGVANGVNEYLYADGLLIGTNTRSTGADKRTVTIGGLTDSTSIPYTGSWALLATWNRALQEAEVASLSANPWQIFRP